MVKKKKSKLRLLKSRQDVLDAQADLKQKLDTQVELAAFLIEKVREEHVGVKDVARFVLREFASTNRRLLLTPSQRINEAVESVSKTPRVEGIPHDWQHGSGLMMGRRALELAKQILSEREVHVETLGKWVVMTRHRAICELNKQVAERDQNHARRQSERAAQLGSHERSSATLTLIHDSGRRKTKPHRRNAMDGKRRKAS